MSSSYERLREEAPAEAVEDKTQESTAADGKGEVAIRLLTLGKEPRKVPVDLSWTVERLRQEAFPEEVKSGKYVKIIYLGKLLDSSSTLTSCGITNDSNVHCVVSDRPPPQPAQPDSEDGEMDDLEAAPSRMFFARRDNLAYLARSNNGTSGDFMMGLILGIILNVYALIWLIPDAVPRRQKIGVIVGLAFYLMIGIMSPRIGNADDTNAPAY